MTLYAFALEAIGDDVAYEKRMCRRHCVPWIPKRAADYAHRSPWIARLTGMGAGMRLQREFLHGRRDYSEANGSGSRGIWTHYLLEDGLYEVNEAIDWRKYRRYFLQVCDGSAREVCLQEVIQCLPS